MISVVNKTRARGLVTRLRRRVSRLSPGALSVTFRGAEGIISKTIQYLNVPSVVGYEDAFLNHLETDFKSLGVTVTRGQGVLALHGKKPYQSIVCAHVDRHGLISLGDGTYAYAAQYVKESRYGAPNLASMKEIGQIGSRFVGEDMIAYNRQTGRILERGTIENCDMCILGGQARFLLPSITDALPAGVPLAYARTASMENDYFKGQLDNAISLAVIYALYARGYTGTALLTTEEEIGQSWQVIARFLDSVGQTRQDLIIIDTSPYADSQPVKDGMVILRTRDKSAEFNRGLCEALHARCGKMGIGTHFKDHYLQEMGKTVDELGSTELGKLILHSQGRWSGATVQIPTLSYHTSRETTSKSAIANYYRFLKHILIDKPYQFQTAST